MSTKVASDSSRLAALRNRVDALDKRIVRLLGLRQRLVAAMPPFKRRLHEPRREADILRLAEQEARRSGLDRAFVRDVYRALLGASRSFLKRRDRLISRHIVRGVDFLSGEVAGGQQIDRRADREEHGQNQEASHRPQRVPGEARQEQG